MERPRNGKQTDRTDTASELSEVRSEAGTEINLVERDPPARLLSTWSQRASLRKRALVKRPLRA